MSGVIGTCKNCNRPLYRGRANFPYPVHRIEDFDSKKPIDCFDPIPILPPTDEPEGCRCYCHGSK